MGGGRFGSEGSSVGITDHPRGFAASLGPVASAEDSFTPDLLLMFFPGPVAYTVEITENGTAARVDVDAGEHRFPIDKTAKVLGRPR